eukprot:TRINITY_DN85_c0_g1_i1.p1 TRINITY_DN85_c0_g1~~TRINITY_DN85_c0_g1_i1.p1  ORF type:complete len:652 (+),score=101.62 TRINITY_DN85_c0_g1_i1:76-2031(+)
MALSRSASLAWHSQTTVPLWRHSKGSQWGRVRLASSPFLGGSSSSRREHFDQPRPMRPSRSLPLTVPQGNCRTKSASYSLSVLPHPSSHAFTTRCGQVTSFPSLRAQPVGTEAASIESPLESASTTESPKLSSLGATPGAQVDEVASATSPSTQRNDESPPPSQRAVRPFQRRVRIADLTGDSEEHLSRVNQEVTVRGWVRTIRSQKTFSFIEVNDGSSLSGLQVVVGKETEGDEQISAGAVTTGAAISVEGVLVASPGGKQKLEVKARRLVLVGGSDAASYPLQKKRHTMEYLRTIAHLRPRTNTMGAVSRVRSALAYATHQFFQSNGFVWVASPIITASDCEGAGEQFCVTTLVPPISADASATAPPRLPVTKEGAVDWSKDFFGRPAFLTVSGQLNAEIYASALHDVYTFGPTFRAEKSNTSRHLAEFWMIEPELAFADLADNMACATAFLKHVVRHVLEQCPEDMAFFDKFIEKGIVERLQAVVDRDFASVTYTEAVRLLWEAKKKFEFPVEWGVDLQSEHERYLTEVIFAGQPLIVTDYPKKIKAFYMRENDDQETVAAMDILVPRVGELMGGSQREERLEVLERRLDEQQLSREAYWWYLDLRRYGSVPHAGFGLGFERLVQFATGVENIRDAIPFPRTPGSADF